MTRYYDVNEIKDVKPYGEFKIIQNDINENFVVIALCETGELLTLKKKI